VTFSGPAWPDALREGVIRELRIELSRRSLSVCEQPVQTPELAPQEVITLLAADPTRVSIVASNIENEGGFTGRTIFIGPIPEDARALAIAQAVDEALRNQNEEAEPRPRPPTSTLPVERQVRQTNSPSWFFGAALAPTLQIAPGSRQRTRTVVSPGAAVRLSFGYARFGGSLGLAITRESDLNFSEVAVRELRLPVDASFNVRLARGPIQVMLDVGLLVALVNYKYRPEGDDHSSLELGGRAGFRVGWGHRIVPWVGASIEVLPSSTDFRFAPTGSLGDAPSLWLGFALGSEVRWP